MLTVARRSGPLPPSTAKPCKADNDRDRDDNCSQDEVPCYISRRPPSFENLIDTSESGQPEEEGAEGQEHKGPQEQVEGDLLGTSEGKLTENPIFQRIEAFDAGDLVSSCGGIKALFDRREKVEKHAFQHKRRARQERHHEECH